VREKRDVEVDVSLRDVTSLQRNKTNAVLVTGNAVSANWKLVPPYLEGK